MDQINDIFSSCNRDMEKIFRNLKEEIHRVRLGSKSIVSFLEKIKIKCYESYFPLIEIANITIIDDMNILIQPWDKSIVSNIDKAIIDANLGFMPTNKGDHINIRIPIITEEGRKNLMKKIKIQTDKAKILIRNVRKKNNQNIKKIKVSEDDAKIIETRIQIITEKYIQKIEDFFLYKEREILKI
ncbi:ribosome-recycling factor [Blattabacterium cuenoti]